MLFLRWTLLAIFVASGATMAVADDGSPQIRLASQASEEEPLRAYRLGVFPYLTPLRMEQIYAPVSAAMAEAVGRRVHFRTSSEFKRFFGNLQKQSYDIAFIQPFWYVPAVDKFGYLPLARMEEPFTSLLMVLDDNPARTLEDLRGKTVATPPAFVPVVAMARKALADRGFVPGRDLELKSFKSVDSCFQQVVIGTAVGCISPPFAPPVVEEKLNIRLRELMRTPSIPNLTFVIHPRVPAEDRARLEHLIMSWAADGEGQDLLKGMRTRRFVRAEDAEYDVVRTLVKESQSQ